MLDKIRTIKLKNGFFNGLTPIIDPFDDTKFYIKNLFYLTYLVKMINYNFEDERFVIEKRGIMLNT